MITFKPTNPNDSCRDTSQLLPTVLKQLNLAIADCAKDGIPVKAIETYRSGQRQHKLFLAKASKLDSTLIGMHMLRLAVDIIINIKGKEYDTTMMKTVVKHFKNRCFLWGNDWDNDGDSKDENFHDSCHFQFVFINEQDDARKLNGNWDKLEVWAKNRLIRLTPKVKPTPKPPIKPIPTTPPSKSTSGGKNTPIQN